MRTISVNFIFHSHRIYLKHTNNHFLEICLADFPDSDLFRFGDLDVTFLSKGKGGGGLFHPSACEDSGERFIIMGCLHVASTLLGAESQGAAVKIFPLHNFVALSNLEQTVSARRRPTIPSLLIKYFLITKIASLFFSLAVKRTLFLSHSLLDS
jgi:hypothetical protein